MTKRKVKTPISWELFSQGLHRLEEREMNIPAVAKELGISAMTVYQWKSKGEVPQMAHIAVQGLLLKMERRESPGVQKVRPFSKETLINLIRRCADDPDLVVDLAIELSTVGE